MVCPGAGGASPDLHKFGAEVERLQLAAQEIAMLCAHTVRTGEAVLAGSCCQPDASRGKASYL